MKIKIISQSLVFITLFQSSAWAVLNTQTSGSAIDSSKLPAATAGCNSICNQLVSGTRHKGLNGGSTVWSRDDDQWCANHGAQTDATVLPGPTPTARPSNPPSCNIALTPDDIATLGSNPCTALNDRIRHCQFHNSQVELNCMAKETAEDARAGNITAIVFDTVAVGLCTSACFMGGPVAGEANPLGAACGVAAMAAGGAEMAAVVQLENNETAKALKGLGAGIGMTSGIFGTVTASSKLRPDSLNVAKDVAKDAARDATKEGAKGAEDSIGSKFKDKGACFSAAIFGIMTGLRAWNVAEMEKTIKNSCKTVEDLVSDATPAPTSTSTSSVGGYGSSGGSTGSGGSSGTGSAGNTGNTGTGNVSLDSNSVVGPCASDPSKLCASQVLGATDGGALTQSGLDRFIAPTAKNLEGQLKDKIQSGASAGELISSALNGTGGSFGEALSNLADMAQRNPQESLQMFPNAASIMSSGGSGGGGGGSKSSDPFASLFGGGAAGGGGIGGGTTTVSNYGSPAKPTDIWHSESKMNLFEIISSKIEIVSYRVTR